MSDVDEKVARWHAWIEGPIRGDVLGLHHRRQIWRELGTITDANQELRDTPSSFWDFLTDTYATTQAIAVRRQADLRRSSCSLARLVHEMATDSTRLTREYFVGLWSTQDEWRLRDAHRAFDALAGTEAKHLVARVPKEDLAVLRRDAAKIKIYVDEHVAHDAADPMADLPTFEDLNLAIDAIGSIFKKYANVLTAGTYVTLEPAIQENWKAVFERPWLVSWER